MLCVCDGWLGLVGGLVMVGQRLRLSFGLRISPLRVDWSVGGSPVVCVLHLFSFMVWFVLCGCDCWLGGGWVSWWLVKGCVFNVVVEIPL